MTTSTAMGSLVLTWPPGDSLVAQGFDRTKPCRSICGIETEEETDADGDAERHEDRRRGKDGWGRRRYHQRQDSCEAEADQDPERAAQAGEEHRLDQELQQDVLTTGADRLSDADLARPLRDGDEHDVHDSDSPDDQGDAGDGAQHQGEDAGRLRSAVEHVLLAQDLEVGRV